MHSKFACLIYLYLPGKYFKPYIFPCKNNSTSHQQFLVLVICGPIIMPTVIFSNTILFVIFGNNKRSNDNPKVFWSGVRTRSPVFFLLLKWGHGKYLVLYPDIICILVWCIMNGHELRHISPLIISSSLFTRFISRLDNRLFLHQLCPFPKLRIYN